MDSRDPFRQPPGAYTVEGTIEAAGAGARGARSALGSRRGRRNLLGLVLFPLLVVLVGAGLWALLALL